MIARMACFNLFQRIWEFPIWAKEGIPRFVAMKGANTTRTRGALDVVESASVYNDCNYSSREILMTSENIWAELDAGEYVMRSVTLLLVVGGSFVNNLGFIAPSISCFLLLNFVDATQQARLLWLPRW
jgi:hypothetical protein